MCAHMAFKTEPHETQRSLHVLWTLCLRCVLGRVDVYGQTGVTSRNGSVRNVTSHRPERAEDAGSPGRVNRGANTRHGFSHFYKFSVCLSVLRAERQPNCAFECFEETVREIERNRERERLFWPWNGQHKRSIPMECGADAFRLTVDQLWT